MEEFKYIIFQLGDQKYAINLMFINGIEQDYVIIPVPNAPGAIKGIINLRGSVIPVYSLRARFGMSDRIDNPSKSLLIVNYDDNLVAYEVDCVEGIEQMNPKDVNRMPSMASTEETSFMEEVLHIGNDIVIAISVDEVISDEMQQKLNEIVTNQNNEG